MAVFRSFYRIFKTMQIALVLCFVSLFISENTFAVSCNLTNQDPAIAELSEGRYCYGSSGGRNTCPAGCYCQGIASGSGLQIQTCPNMPACVNNWCNDASTDYGAIGYGGARHCPLGYPSSVSGSTSKDDCYLTVPKGYYKTSTSDSDNGTTACEAGYYCLGGIVPFGETGKKACGSGYYNPKTGSQYAIDSNVSVWSDVCLSCPSTDTNYAYSGSSAKTSISECAERKYYNSSSDTSTYCTGGYVERTSTVIGGWGAADGSNLIHVANAKIVCTTTDCTCEACPIEFPNSTAGGRANECYATIYYHTTTDAVIGSDGTTDTYTAADVSNNTALASGPTAPSGKYFVGWCVKNSAGVACGSNPTVYTTIQSNWSGNKYLGPVYCNTGETYSAGTGCVAQQQTYTLVLHNGNNYHRSISNATAGTTVTVPYETPTQTGKIFAGWCDNKDSNNNGSGNCSTGSNWTELNSVIVPASPSDTTLHYYAKFITPVFSLTTTSAATIFSFWIAATGNFYVDCGTNGTFYANGTSTGNQIGYINSNSTTQAQYSCSYSSAGAHEIKFGGVATDYNTLSTTPAISFTMDKTYSAPSARYYSNNAEKIASVSGSLGALFPSLTSNGAQQTQPRFYYTFYGASNLQRLPVGFFDGITGTTTNMFNSTFHYTDALEYVPDNLFANITGNAAEGMFLVTFGKDSSATTRLKFVHSDNDQNPKNYVPSGMFNSSLTNSSNLTYSNLGWAMFTTNNIEYETSCPANTYKNYVPAWTESAIFADGTDVMCTNCPSSNDNLRAFPFSDVGRNNDINGCYTILDCPDISAADCQAQDIHATTCVDRADGLIKYHGGALECGGSLVQITECETGYVPNTFGTACVMDCNDGYDDSCGMCIEDETCGEDESWNSGTCQCESDEPVCPGDYEWDDDLSDCACPDGEIDYDNDYTCHTECGQNEEWDSAEGECVAVQQSCSSNQVDVDGTCYNGKFALKTTNLSANDTFQFKMSAAGNFTVDCGDGGSLSGTGVSGNTITRNNTDVATYTCTWANADSHVITFDGSADGYSRDTTTAAIRFNMNGYTNETNAPKIASIYGSLGAVFGTKTNPTVGQSQPRFHQTFYGASNMTGSIPANLFAGISGSPTPYMFGYTFYDCSGLTGSIPSGLFGNLTGSPAENMFAYTFSGCSGLTGFTDGTNTTTYVPGDFLSGINTDTSVLGQTYNMFYNTGLVGSCPSGTTNVTRTQFNDAQKPWCATPQVACELQGQYYYWDTENETCEYDPQTECENAGNTWSNSCNVCIEDENCADGYDETMCECEEAPLPKCTDGYDEKCEICYEDETCNGQDEYWDNSTCSCHTGCTGILYDNSCWLNMEEYCSTKYGGKYEWDSENEECVLNSPTCPGDYEWDDDLGDCACPDGEIDYDNDYTCHTECDQNEEWSGAEGRCICAGYEYDNTCYANEDDYCATEYGATYEWDDENNECVSNSSITCPQFSSSWNSTAVLEWPGAAYSFTGGDECIAARVYGQVGNYPSYMDSAAQQLMELQNTFDSSDPLNEDALVSVAFCKYNENTHNYDGDCTPAVEICQNDIDDLLETVSANTTSADMFDMIIDYAENKADTTIPPAYYSQLFSSDSITTQSFCSITIYTITLDKNGGDANVGTDYLYAVPYDQPKTWGVYLDENATQPGWDNAYITIPTRSGYTFVGYYDTAAATGGTQMIDSSGLILSALDESTQNADDDYSIYARWESNSGGNTPTCPTFSTTLASGPAVELPGMGIDLNNDNQITSDECVATRLYGGMFGNLMSADDNDIPSEYLQLVQLARSQNTYNASHGFNYAAMVFVFCKYNSQTGNYDGDCTYGVPICNIFGDDLNSLTGTTTSDMFNFVVDYIESKTNQTISPSSYGNLFALRSSSLSVNFDVYSACSRGCTGTTYWDGWECLFKDDNYCRNEYGASNVWDSTAEECVVSCSEDGYFPAHYDSGSYGYCEYYDRADEDQCATVVSLYGDTYYWNSENNMCERCDSGNIVENGVCRTDCEYHDPYSHWDATLGECVINQNEYCAYNHPHTVYDSTNESCVCDTTNNYYGDRPDVCTFCNIQNGYTWTGSLCTCESPKVVDNGYCHVACTGNTGWNGSACAACSTGQIAVDGQCANGDFAVKVHTTTDNEEFQFKMSAAGTFTVDCGGGTLSGTGVSGNTITRNNTNAENYTCTYSTPGDYAIGFRGTPTGYNTNCCMNDTAAISFVNGDYWVTTNVEKITGMAGSLGAVFGTVANPISGTGSQPKFSLTFYGASNMRGTIPATLFAGISGEPVYGMFDSTFSYCSNLTGSIPADLFSGISGAPAYSMFDSTFNGCSGLTGSIPANLFSGISGAPAQRMFEITFQNCSNLSGYIPPRLFAGISRDTTAQDQMTYVFSGSGLATSCTPYDMDVYTTGFEDNFNGKVSCGPSTPTNTTVTLYQNASANDTNTNGSVTATFNSAMPSTNIAAPTRSGYTFTGYYDRRDGGLKYYEANMSPTSQVWLDTNATAPVYAQWAEITSSNCQTIMGNDYYWNASANNGAGACVVKDNDWCTISVGANYTWDSENNTCSCESPYEQDEGACHESCPGETAWSTQCSMCEEECSEGEIWDFNTCSCHETCTGDYEWDSSAEYCRCPEGYADYDGNDTCHAECDSETEYWNGTQCAAKDDAYCELETGVTNEWYSGYYWDGTQCQDYSCDIDTETWNSELHRCVYPCPGSNYEHNMNGVCVEKTTGCRAFSNNVLPLGRIAAHNFNWGPPYFDYVETAATGFDFNGNGTIDANECYLARMNYADATGIINNDNPSDQDVLDAGIDVEFCKWNPSTNNYDLACTQRYSMCSVADANGISITDATTQNVTSTLAGLMNWSSSDLANFNSMFTYTPINAPVYDRCNVTPQPGTCPTLTTNTTINGIPVRAVSSDNLEFAMIPSLTTTYNGECVVPAIRPGGEHTFMFYIKNYTEMVDYLEDDGTIPTNDIKFSPELEVCNSETSTIAAMSPSALLSWYQTRLQADGNSLLTTQIQSGTLGSDGFYTFFNTSGVNQDAVLSWLFTPSSRCPVTCEAGEYLYYMDGEYMCQTCSENDDRCCLENEHTYTLNEYRQMGNGDSLCPTNDTSYCQDVFGPGYTWDSSAGECVGDNDTYCVNTYGSGYHWDDVNKVCSSEVVQTTCPSGAYMDHGACISCALGTNGAYTQSDGGLGDINTCYRACSIANATTVTGRNYYGTGVDTCEATACATGYHLTTPSVVSHTPIVPLDYTQGGFDFAYIDKDGNSANSGDYALGGDLSDNNTWVVSFANNQNPGVLFGRASCQSSVTTNNSGALYVYNNLSNVQNGNMSIADFQSGLSAIVGEQKTDYAMGLLSQAMSGTMTMAQTAAQFYPMFNTVRDAQYSTTDSGRYCYCQIDGWIASGESKQNITNAPWIIVWDYGSSNQCASNCAATCANATYSDDQWETYGIRSGMYNSYVPQYSTCEADAAQSTCPTITSNTTVGGIPVRTVQIPVGANDDNMTLVLLANNTTTYNGDCVVPALMESGNELFMYYIKNYDEIIDYVDNGTTPTNPFKISPRLQICDNEISTLATLSPEALAAWYVQRLQSDGSSALAQQSEYLDSNGFFTFTSPDTNGFNDSNAGLWRWIFSPSYRCPVTCDAGEYLVNDDAGYICESCGEYGDNCCPDTSQTYSKAEYSVLDYSATLGLTNCETGCASGYTYDSVEDTCTDSNGCTPDEIYDSELSACRERCVGGKIWVNNACACPTHQTWDSENNQCVGNNDDWCVDVFGAGYTWDETNEVCVSSVTPQPTCPTVTPNTTFNGVAARSVQSDNLNIYLLPNKITTYNDECVIPCIVSGNMLFYIKNYSELIDLIENETTPTDSIGLSPQLEICSTEMQTLMSMTSDALLSWYQTTLQSDASSALTRELSSENSTLSNGFFLLADGNGGIFDWIFAPSQRCPITCSAGEYLSWDDSYSPFYQCHECQEDDDRCCLTNEHTYLRSEYDGFERLPEYNGMTYDASLCPTNDDNYCESVFGSGYTWDATANDGAGACVSSVTPQPTCPTVTTNTTMNGVPVRTVHLNKETEAQNIGSDDHIALIPSFQTTYNGECVMLAAIDERIAGGTSVFYVTHYDELIDWVENDTTPTHSIKFSPELQICTNEVSQLMSLTPEQFLTWYQTTLQSDGSPLIATAIQNGYADSNGLFTINDGDYLNDAHSYWKVVTVYQRCPITCQAGEFLTQDLNWLQDMYECHDCSEDETHCCLTESHTYLPSEYHDANFDTSVCPINDDNYCENVYGLGYYWDSENGECVNICPAHSTVLPSGAFVELPGTGIDFDNDGEITVDECIAARGYGNTENVLSQSDWANSTTGTALYTLMQQQNTYDVDNSLNSDMIMGVAFCRYDESTGNYDGHCTPAINLCSRAEILDFFDDTDATTLSTFNYAIDLVEEMLGMSLPTSYYDNLFTDSGDDISIQDRCTWNPSYPGSICPQFSTTFTSYSGAPAIETQAFGASYDFNNDGEITMDECITTRIYGSAWTDFLVLYAFGANYGQTFTASAVPNDTLSLAITFSEYQDAQKIAYYSSLVKKYASGIDLMFTQQSYPALIALNQYGSVDDMPSDVAMSLLSDVNMQHVAGYAICRYNPQSGNYDGDCTPIVQACNQSDIEALDAQINTTGVVSSMLQQNPNAFAYDGTQALPLSNSCSCSGPNQPDEFCMHANCPTGWTNYTGAGNMSNAEYIAWGCAPIRYEVYLDGNSADSGSMGYVTDDNDSDDLLYGTQYTLPLNEYTRDGYTFAGWNTEPDGSGVSFADGATIQNLTSDDEDRITLYAQWTACPGGTCISCPTVTPNANMGGIPVWNGSVTQQNGDGEAMSITVDLVPSFKTMENGECVMLSVVTDDSLGITAISYIKNYAEFVNWAENDTMPTNDIKESPYLEICSNELSQLQNMQPDQLLTWYRSHLQSDLSGSLTTLGNEGLLGQDGYVSIADENGLIGDWLSVRLAMLATGFQRCPITCSADQYLTSNGILYLCTNCVAGDTDHCCLTYEHTYLPSEYKDPGFTNASCPTNDDSYCESVFGPNYVWDDVSQQCHEKCSSGTQWDSSLEQCVSCDSGQYWDEETGTCVASCGTNTIQYENLCIENKFQVSILPPSVDDGFTFQIAASGEFYVDCGNRGRFVNNGTNTGNQIGYINTEEVSSIQYACKYSGTDEHVIKYGGLATGYNPSLKASISFYDGATVSQSNTRYIQSIEGSLGKIFPTLTQSTTVQLSPSFMQTFMYATRLTTIPERLFVDADGNGVTGSRNDMFQRTFDGCSNLTTIPSHLFTNENGVGITESASHMFSSTFANCNQLTTIPADLFSAITGDIGIAGSTFAGCTRLKKFSPATVDDPDAPDYIPVGFFNSDLTNPNNAPGAINNMFEGTQLSESCPANTYLNYSPSWITASMLNNKVMCSPCPSGFGSAAGSTSIEQCTKQYTCDMGQYLYVDVENETEQCEVCPAGSYCPGGTYTIDTAYTGINQCPANTHAPAGMWNENQCGRRLHVGDHIIYLHAGKLTTPSLQVSFDGVTYYGNMSLEKKNMSHGIEKHLQIMYNEDTYYVYDDTITQEERGIYDTPENEDEPETDDPEMDDPGMDEPGTFDE